jgi:tetratricopeptide (TPR) repeat protein
LLGRFRDSTTSAPWPSPRESIAAHEHVLKATEHALRVSPDDNARAREEALAALRRDPAIVRAHGILALTYISEGSNFWVADPSPALRSACDLAGKAVAADPRDPWGHAMLSIADLWYNRAPDRAVSHVQNAIRLNPGNAQIRSLYSYILAFTGDPDTALAEIDTAIRMNPHFPPLFHGFRGRALLMLRPTEDALLCLEQMMTLMPGHSNALGYAAAAYAALGRIDEACAVVERLRVSNANYRLGALRRTMPFRQPVDLRFILENLALAGLPE